ncbi:uncharacterized protein LOC129588759 [Paramacrobiotus metropolitanus]|uniref:uncharacterized protein LOC129588759 n=1 Tax=Paramacrobiotus metropolitanus TaxID=2943436 RepID=UPI002445E3D7|nr:uncharacterized protein LOC129588759 [Paramacrobiotus metropolitanus]
MNIRKSNIPDGAALYILRTDNGTHWTTVKIIAGGRSAGNSYPPSVAQLKAGAISLTTQLRIVYIGDGIHRATNSSHYELEIEYTVLNDIDGLFKVWCEALGAHIYRDIACEDRTRLTWPSDYYDTVNRNPATGFGTCEWSSSEIIGTVIGCIIGLIIFGTGGVIWYNRKGRFLCRSQKRKRDIMASIVVSTIY